MTYLLLLLSVLLAGVRSVLSKLGNHHTAQKQDALSFFFWLFAAGAAVISVGFVGNGYYHISGATLGLACLYAFFTGMSQALLMRATDCGDVALSSLIYSCGFLLPTVFGAIAYREAVTVPKVLGICVIVLSLAVGTVSGKRTQNRKWLWYALGAMGCSGTVGILQKVFRMSRYAAEFYGFLLLAFLLLSVLLLILMPKHETQKHPKRFFILAVSIGICFGSVNWINTYLSGALPSILLFPATNGGTVLCSALLARLLIKERLSVRKWIGVAIGLVGILVVAIS